ncbi:MAG: hypothetical protein ABL857_07820 [Rickettsiales bacterium]|jgi:hypothetical protein
MKHSIALGLILAAFSTSAMAEVATPVPAENTAVLETAKKAPDHARAKHYMGRHKDRMWKELDANSDNFVSAEESDAFGKKKFQEKDLNKDGKISKEEWDSSHKAKMLEIKEKHGKMPMGDKIMDGEKPSK